MGYQEDRLRRIHIFEDTIQYCERNGRLANAILQTRKNTVLYQNPVEQCSKKRNRYNVPHRMRVARDSILEVAKKLYLEYPDCRIGILNFASAMYPGGEVIRGGEAQEECLCRCTTLYPCLNTEKLLQQYYGCNREQENTLYTDACIFTPGIVSIRTDGISTDRMRESEWFLVDIISCSVLNPKENVHNITNFSGKGEVLAAEPHLLEVLSMRLEGCLQVAVENDIEILIVGTFGCGIFDNSPHMMTQIYKKALKAFRYSFKAIEFAAYHIPKDREGSGIHL